MDIDREIFENAPVPKAIIKTALPAIISMIVVIIYNIADTYFVGQTGDPLQVAAVSLAIPVFLLFMATGNLIGIGGTSVISRALGARKPEYAKQVSSFSFYASIVLGLVFAGIFVIFMDFILSIIGTSEDTAEYTRQYLMIIAPSAPFVILSTAFSNIVRAEGKAKTAMIGMMLGTIVNIILDPIMIISMNMGVGGAALATLIGNVAGTLYYTMYLWKHSPALSIKVKDFRIGGGVMTAVMAIGIPAALNNVLMSISNIILNNYLAIYGDLEVAAMGVAMKVVLIVVLLHVGLGVGIQPLLGYSFGAGNYKRYREIMNVSILYSLILGVAITAASWVGARTIVQAFIENATVVDLGVQFVHSLLITGPVLGIMFVYINSLQAMGAGRESLILSVSRQGLVFIPMLVILNALYQTTGVVYAQPAADFFTLGFSAILYGWQARKFKQRHEAPIQHVAPLATGK